MNGHFIARSNASFNPNTTVWKWSAQVFERAGSWHETVPWIFRIDTRLESMAALLYFLLRQWQWFTLIERNTKLILFQCFCRIFMNLSQPDATLICHSTKSFGRNNQNFKYFNLKNKKTMKITVFVIISVIGCST